MGRCPYEQGKGRCIVDRETGVPFRRKLDNTEKCDGNPVYPAYLSCQYHINGAEKQAELSTTPRLHAERVTPANIIL